MHGDLLCTDTFHALRIQDDVPSFALYAGSPSRGLCFRIVVAKGELSDFAIGGNGWSISAGEVTNDPGDCDVDDDSPWSPLDQSSSAHGGEGHISVESAPTGCTLGIHAVVMFPDAPTWAPEYEVFERDGIVIEGGCL
ncbi:Hypothetical protein A7982_06103 [Minicystis rosea]|nr:Hypothetical protein A7982_06103 [Minicystis rosea]